MKAIQTAYNSYLFRSRLEARWAFFFDSIGVDYEYEPEGYELDGVRYLPDFWIPCPDFHEKGGYFVEIKRKGTPNKGETQKAILLAKESGHTAIILCGDPVDCQKFEYNRCGSFHQGAFNRDPIHPCVRFLHGQGNYDHGYSLATEAELARSARFEFGETPNV